MNQLITMASSLLASEHLTPRQTIPAFKPLVHELFIQQAKRSQVGLRPLRIIFAITCSHHASFWDA